MEEDIVIKELDQVVVRFSGDSGDGMQLAGNIFSTISATVGNDISTFLPTSVPRKVRLRVFPDSRCTSAMARYILPVTVVTCWWR